MRFTWPHGRRTAISLSFDDARPSNPDNGFALLNRHGVKATFYVVPGPLDQRLDAWKQAVADGHEIGNHTIAHPCSCNYEFIRKWGVALEDYTPERIEKEIHDANDQIQAKLGVTPRTFAYPCGETFVGRGQNVRSYVPMIARDFIAGRGASASAPIDVATCDLAHVRAHSIDSLDFPAIKAILDKAVDVNGWNILVGHDIGLNAVQSVGLDVLDELCRYANDPDNGIWIDTVANVAEYVAKSGRAVG